MAVEVASGASTDIDDTAAARAALSQARSQLAGPPAGALLYLSTSYDARTVLDHVAQSLGAVALIGCTTSGLVTARGRHESDGVLVVLLGGEIRCAAAVGRDLHADSAGVARSAAKELMAAAPDAGLILMHPDPIGLDGTSIVRGVQEAAPAATVVGGNAGEFTGRLGTLQFFGREVLGSAVPLMAICGDVRVSTGRGCGWRPIGRRYEVTRVVGRTVFEVEGQPVLDVLREYTPHTGLESLADTPFAVYGEASSPTFYLRAVERVEKESGGLVLVTAVPLGARLQFTEASVEDVLYGAEESATKALQAYGGRQPKAAFMFSCTARRWLLASRVAEESSRLASALTGPAAQAPLVGFYAHGEIGPLESGGQALHHNQTCVTLLVGD